MSLQDSTATAPKITGGQRLAMYNNLSLPLYNNLSWFAFILEPDKTFFN